MAEYDNSGSFSKNTRKEKETHPDIKGKATIGGVKYWVDGWQKKGNDGGIWYSLSFKRADKQTSAMESPPPPPRSQLAHGIPGLNRETDEIPF